MPLYTYEQKYTFSSAISYPNEEVRDPKKGRLEIVTLHKNNPPFSYSSWASGSETKNVEPFPSSLSTQIFPSWAWMISWEIYKPMPSPGKVLSWEEVTR